METPSLLDHIPNTCHKSEKETAKKSFEDAMITNIYLVVGLGVLGGLLGLGRGIRHTLGQIRLEVRLNVRREIKEIQELQDRNKSEWIPINYKRNRRFDCCNDAFSRRQPKSLM